MKIKKASIISKILVEPLEQDLNDPTQKLISRPQTAKKNVSSKIYETADTMLSSNYLTFGGISNKIAQERKNSASGLENFTRDPLDVLLPNDVLFGLPTSGQ